MTHHSFKIGKILGCNGRICEGLIGKKIAAKKYENSKEKIIFVYIHKSSILPV